MDIQKLAEQAAEYDRFFTGLMNKVPTFFTQHTHPNINSKYVFKGSGFAPASFKTKRGEAQPTASAQGGGDENDDDDDEMKDDDVNIVMEDDDDDVDDDDSEMEGVEFDDDDEDVGFGAPKSFADLETLKKRLIEKSQTLLAQPKLTPEEIKARKAKRAEKDRIAKEKGVKQKAAPSGGHSEHQSDVVHTNKKQKTEANDDANEEVQLDKIQFAKVIQNHVSKSVEQAGTKHLTSKKGTVKQQLKQLESFKGTVQALRAGGDDEKADAMVHKKAVDTALQRAMGENVNDNIHSLKKQVKIQEKAKDKSKKAWGQRAKQQEKDLNERLDARDLHIRKKIEHKKNKRIGKKD